MEEKISKIVEGYYKIAIPYVNHRVIPSFEDGLKPAQRRTIYAMLNIASKHKVKVASIAGECLAHYHPHGDQSIVDVVVDLVNKGVLEGQGNFGQKYLYNKDDDAAAPRYIEAGLSASFSELTRTLLKYCPMIDSEVDGTPMPKRLFFPIPIAAITGSRGLGLAANTNIPAFTAESLLDAYKNDDYHLLKSTYGAEIVREKSNLRKIWEIGHGKITYRLKVYKGEFSGLKGVFMEGNPYLFGKIDLSSFNNYKRDNLVVFFDVGNKLFIGKQFGIRKINEDDIYRKCMKIRDVSDTYMITLNKGGVIGRSPLRYWIASVYEEYIKVYTKYINDKIKSKESDIKVLSYVKEVGKRLLANESDESIIKSLKIEQWILNEISKKSISYLRKDNKPAIDKLKSEIRDLKSLDITKSVDKLIRDL